MIGNVFSGDEDAINRSLPLSMAFDIVDGGEDAIMLFNF